jgi:hypothetical protein
MARRPDAGRRCVAASDAMASPILALPQVRLFSLLLIRTRDSRLPA